MTLPNFLIIGAAKSATTSLWSYLKQHPEVFVARYKEPNYYALAGTRLPDGGPASPQVIQRVIHQHSVTDFNRYAALFDGADQSAIGEASVRYLYYPMAAGRIREQLPDVRLLVVLREPVSRLYSHYSMMVQFQMEPLRLMDAIGAEQERRAAGWGWDWHYAAVSSYASQLKRYFDLFDRGQIKVVLYEDLRERPLQVFEEVCRFLRVSDRFEPDTSKREKVAYRAHNLMLDRWLNWPGPTRDRLMKLRPRRVTHRVLRQLHNWNTEPAPLIDPRDRHTLERQFREEVAAVEDLLSRKTGWLT